ncbi:putative glycerol-3-phosphate transporter 1 [Ananas comosus]|uniref:Glycerol-3-phosphate transporter 1 n=1 Tax=Ananas comosus TaxID=4615 RepID=A0A6P5ENM4_ANACO|nr:putative glycerol-3-phosphate transporter 1 [Ananas comosus]XP_020085072.1 putative glycerol-3-phosphate transporter 1 [Ananas comosus]
MGSSSEQLNEPQRRKPLGVRFLGNIKGAPLSFRTCQTIVLVLTFFAYASYHATRKTTSIVKSVLDPETAKLGFAHWPSSYYLRTLHRTEDKRLGSANGWAPFSTADGTALLGDIDVAFLSIYALGMYFAGHLGDRLDLRILLTTGMVGTGLFTALFGAGYWLNIHNFFYFLVVQMIAGLLQSTGWPSVVAVVGNWFGKSKRGLIMGIWNAHTSIGNISGSLIAAALLKYGWGWSFVVPGVIIAVIGLIVFLFLPVSPEVGVDEDEVLKYNEKNEVAEPLLGGYREEVKEKAVGFVEAWRIPGVAPFALCLFFSKLVAYTFLYWLPFYISHTEIDGKYLSNTTAGTLSTLFDVGGVVGGILAGHISDRLDARAMTAAGFMYCAIPALFFYRIYGGISLYWNIALMFIAGVFVNGPYSLITTAVSADLGTHSSLNGNSRALATVTAIIDGTGSVGAAVGPLLTGYISASSWSAVFTMLMGAALVAGLLLTRLVVAEVSAKIEAKSLSYVAASDLPVSSMVEP